MQPAQRWRDDSAAEDDLAFRDVLLEGSAQLQQGDVTRARTLLEQALRLRPQNEQARNLLGQTYFRMGLYDPARRVYEKLSGEYPDEPTFLMNLALVWVKKGEPAAARAPLEKVCAVQPDNAKALSYLGVVYERLGEWGLARWAFGQAGSPKLVEHVDALIRQRGGVPADEVPAWAQPAADLPMEPARRSPDERTGPTEVMLPLSPPLPAEPPAQSDDPTSVQQPHAAAASVPPPTAQAPAPPAEEPKSFGAALPRLLSAVAAEAAPERAPAQDPPAGPSSARPEWTQGQASADSMVVSLSKDAMTGAQWLQNKSLPPVVRPFSVVGPGLLGLTVDGDVLVRALTLAAVQGDVDTQPAYRDDRGTPRLLGGEDDPLVTCSGRGSITLDPAGSRVSVLKLQDTEATVLETALFGASTGVTRQDVLLPLIKNAPGVPAVRFTGVGVVAVRYPQSVRAVEVVPSSPLRVSLDHLLAFEGPLTCAPAPGVSGLPNLPVPRAAVLSGRGVVLLRAGGKQGGPAFP